MASRFKPDSYGKVASQALLTVVVVYTQTEDSSASSKDEFYTTLESVITSRPPHDQLVVLSDFNAVTGTNRAGIGGFYLRLG